MTDLSQPYIRPAHPHALIAFVTRPISRIPLHHIIRIVRSSVSLSLSRRRSLHSLITFLPLPSTPPNPMLPFVSDVRKLMLAVRKR